MNARLDRLSHCRALWWLKWDAQKYRHAYKNAMKKVDYAKTKLLVGLEKVCWEPNGALAAVVEHTIYSPVCFSNLV